MPTVKNIKKILTTLADYYYENKDGATFVENTLTTFGKTPHGAMGVKFFDYNNDGSPDLLITDMHSDMGASQSYAMEKSKTNAAVFQQDHMNMASDPQILGNAFYTSVKGAFKEISDAIGVETYWPWGVSVGDYNADGYQDVFISAGMGTIYRYGINSLLLNNSGKGFMDSEFLLGIEPRSEIHHSVKGCGNEAASSRASVAFDLDQDGDLDIVTNQPCTKPQVFISNLTQSKTVNFLKVKLSGTVSNRDGLGATVTVSAGGNTYSQFNDGKSGYLSQSSIPLYFGLDKAEKADSVEVQWPSGRTTTLHNVAINTQIEIREQ